MEVIREVALLFFTSLGLGTQLFQPVVSSRLTGAGFWKLIASVCLGAMVVASILIATNFNDLGFGQRSWWFFASVGSLFVYSITLQDEPKILTGVLYALSLLAMGMGLLSLGETWRESLYLFSSAALIGVSNFAMLLGHYYLVVPKLTERPLIICNVVLWGVLLIKFGASCYFTYLWTNDLNGNFYSDYMFNGIFLSMRFLWGYLALGILSYFTYRLSKMRSIQSSTGVLYVMVFFVIVSELIALYLFKEYGVLI